MSDELQVRKALAAILAKAILLIRSNSSNKDAVRFEAVHIHNLPHLLLHLKPELLRFYWEVERAEYVRSADPLFSSVYQDDWVVLKSYLEQGGQSGSVCSSLTE